MQTSPEVLRESLQRHNDTFESLLRLIPPQYYLVNDGANDHQVCVLPLPIYARVASWVVVCEKATAYLFGDRGTECVDGW